MADQLRQPDDKIARYDASIVSRYNSVATIIAISGLEKSVKKEYWLWAQKSRRGSKKTSSFGEVWGRICCCAQ